uniref:Uncharacterized protein n=1 Tax=Anguilla anguilla TaxID=7936 RepID=A0A0E9TRT1_ANGAN
MSLHLKHIIICTSYTFSPYRHGMLVCIASMLN